MHSQVRGDEMPKAVDEGPVVQTSVPVLANVIEKGPDLVVVRKALSSPLRPLPQEASTRQRRGTPSCSLSKSTRANFFAHPRITTVLNWRDPSHFAPDLSPPLIFSRIRARVERGDLWISAGHAGAHEFAGTKCLCGKGMGHRGSEVSTSHVSRISN